MLLYALCVHTAGAERHFLLSYRTRASKLFGDPRNYLVILELPCKFRTHRLDKKDSSKQKRLFSDPGTRMQVSYPHVRQEIQFETEEYYYEYELSVRKGVQLTLAFLDYR